MDSSLYSFYMAGIFSVLSVSSVTYLVLRRCEFNLRRILSWLLIILPVLSSYMFFAQYFKYHSLHFYVDFSCWAQLFHNTATVGKPLCLNEELMHSGCMNYFSAHFVPCVYILAIPFKLWPRSETLIILNFLLMVSSAIPLYKLTLIYHKNKQFGLFIAALLLWYPTFQYIVLYEFEMLRFSIPIILWMLYFWEKRRIRLYFLFVVLAILVREEVGLTIMMFGLYVLLIEKERKKGLLTTLIGLGGFIVITQVIMPILRTTYGYEHIAIGSFGAFGNTMGEIVINIVKHPLFLLRTIFRPIKLANIFMYFLPLLFIPLLAPSVLINIFANLGVGMLSKSNVHISYMLYYLSPSVPFIFYAFIKGWPKLLAVLRKFTSASLRKVDVQQTAMVSVLSGLLVCNIFFGPSPISLQFWFKKAKPAPFRTQNFHHTVYKVTDHHRKVEEFCKIISDPSIVSAQHFLFPRLFKKRGTMVFPKLESADGRFKADYVFFDKTNNGLNEESPSYKTQRDFDLVEKDIDTWKLVKSEDGYFLYKRIKK